MSAEARRQRGRAQLAATRKKFFNTGTNEEVTHEANRATRESDEEEDGPVVPKDTIMDGDSQRADVLDLRKRNEFKPLRRRTTRW